MSFEELSVNGLYTTWACSSTCTCTSVLPHFYTASITQGTCSCTLWVTCACGILNLSLNMHVTFMTCTCLSSALGGTCPHLYQIVRGHVTSTTLRPRSESPVHLLSLTFSFLSLSLALSISPHLSHRWTGLRCMTQKRLYFCSSNKTKTSPSLLRGR